MAKILFFRPRHLYKFCLIKIFSTNYNGNLVLLDDPGRVRSQIATVVCQIQRFDFDGILILKDHFDCILTAF